MEDDFTGMSTDGPTLPPCDPEIFAHGEQVFVTDSIPSNVIEGWVKQVAEKSGQSVDWHFVGGRAEVLALGDIIRVKAAILDLLPEHNRLRQEAIDHIMRKPESETNWQPIDTAPSNKRILVYVPIQRHRFVIAIKIEEGLWLAEDYEPMSYLPSHWMPLPKPPD